MFEPCVRLTTSRGQYWGVSLDASYVDHLQANVGDENVFSVQVAILAWVSLLMDSPIDRYKPKPVVRRFFFQLRDYRQIVSSYADLCDKLLRDLRLEDGAISSPFLPEFKDTPIFREYLQFRKTASPELLRYIVTFLTFAKKNGYKDASFESNALRDWIKLEEDMRDRQLPEWVDNLRPVADYLLQGFSFDRAILPSHGNGAVSEEGCRTSEEKNSVLTSTVSQAIVSVYDGQHRRHYDAITSALPLLGALSTAHSRIDRAARLKFVTKDYKSVRSICMEPTAYQWLQQGLRVQLEGHFAKHEFVRLCVRLKDQGINRSGSMFGSYTGRVSTIDLSSASDSVLWLLIKRMVPPGIAFHLAISRSDRVLLPDGTEFKISKFAPMGSALCFPTQCLVYLTVITYVGICQAYGRDYRKPGALDGVGIRPFEAFCPRPNYWDDKDTRFHLPIVYGDDMITDYRITSNVMSALRELGFKVNEGKSFTLPTSPIRESCGKYHFLGNDITPFRLKIPVLSMDGLALADLGSIIDNANDASAAGYENCACLLRKLALHHPLFGCKKKFNAVRFTTKPESFELYSILPDNSHLNTRFNKTLFIREEECLCPRVVNDSNLGVDDNYHYIKHWRSISDNTGTPLKRGGYHKIARELRVGMGWKPVLE